MRTECLFKADVRLINSQIKESEKGKDQLLMSFYRDTLPIENSVKRESTVPETEKRRPKLRKEFTW